MQKRARLRCPLPRAGTQWDIQNFSGSCGACPVRVQCIKPLARCKVRKGFSLSEGNHRSGLLHSFTVRCVLWTVGSSAYFHVANPCYFRDQRHWHCSRSLDVSKEYFNWRGCLWQRVQVCCRALPSKHPVRSLLLLSPLHQSLPHCTQPQASLSKKSQCPGFG